jgi:hypothetical protein
MVIIGVFLLVSIVLIESNWYSTNYSVVITQNKEGTSYRHEQDARTTGIINYLTGNGELPETERLPLYRQYVKNRLEEVGMDVPGNFRTLTWQEINSLAVQWYQRKYPNHPRDEAALQKLINELFENAIRPPLESFTPNVNDNLWLLLIKVGSPQVRWIEEQDDEFSRFIVAYGSDDKQAFYNPVNHTIYVSYANAVDDLLDEVGHGKQFRDQPLRSYYRMIGSMLTAWIGAEFDLDAAKVVYKLRYKKVGTFEYEAHGPIKDRLMEESGLLIVEQTAPAKK